MLMVSLSPSLVLPHRLEMVMEELEQLLLVGFSWMETVTVASGDLWLEESMMEILMDSALELRLDLASVNKMVKHRQQLSLEPTCRLPSLQESNSTGLAMLEVCNPLFLVKLPLSLTSSTFSNPVDSVASVASVARNTFPCNLFTQAM